MGLRRPAIASVAGVLCLTFTGCATPPPPGPGSVARPHYVAMGDSVAAAPGVPESAAPRGCRKSTNNYPSVLARRVDAATFTDVTCSGATTDDITNRAQQTDHGLIPRQIDAVEPTTDLVTITIGANDIGMSGNAEVCRVATPHPKPCRADFVVGGVDKVSEVINAQVPLWATMIDQIRAEAPRLRIILVGYGFFIRSGGCFPSQPLLPTDADYLQAKVDELNDRQRDLAAQKRIEFFDTRTLSQGHDMCAPPAERYVEGYVTTVGAVPLHPTALGAEAVGNALTDYLIRSAYS